MDEMSCGKNGFCARREGRCVCVRRGGKEDEWLLSMHMEVDRPGRHLGLGFPIDGPATRREREEGR